MSRTVAVALAGVLALGAGGAANAVIIESFEDGTAGFSSTVSVSPTGATHGSQALAVTGTGFRWLESDGNNSAKMQANAAAITGATTIYIDVTWVPDEDGATSTDTGWWANFKLSYNDGGAGWRESPQVDAPQVGGAVQPGTHTLAFNVSSLAAPNYAAGNWFKYAIGVNWNATDTGDPVGTLYIDSIRTTEAVPEPASLALLGLGGLAMLCRRR